MTIRRDRAQKLKQLIIDKSAQLFLQKGFHGTTLRDIIDALGISKGALYWHFSSKEDVLNTIIDHYQKSFESSVMAGVEDFDGTAVGRLTHYQKLAANFAYKNKDLCMAIMTLSGEMVGTNTEAERKIRAFYDRHLDFTKRLLRSTAQEGEFRDDLDIEMTARVMHAMQNGALLDWYVNYSKNNSGSLVRHYMKILLTGIFKHVRPTEKPKSE
jgi:AcrR family transcriptional regulator